MKGEESRSRAGLVAETERAMIESGVQLQAWPGANLTSFGWNFSQHSTATLLQLSPVANRQQQQRAVT